jgi:hypothetical protein
MAISVRSKQSFTTQADQTIASIVSGDCVIFIGCVSDGDTTHRVIDAPFTVGGVAMTAVTQSTVGGQNNQVDIYYLKNAAGGTSVTWSNKYHAGSPGFQGAIYVLSGADTASQPSNTGHAESTAAANPTVTLTGLSAGDLILEGIAGNNTPTAGSSQTVDYTSAANGSSFAISQKSAASGSNAESWTMSSAAYAYNLIAILATASSISIVAAEVPGAAFRLRDITVGY